MERAQSIGGLVAGQSSTQSFQACPLTVVMSIVLASSFQLSLHPNVVFDLCDAIRGLHYSIPGWRVVHRLTQTQDYRRQTRR